MKNLKELKRELADNKVQEVIDEAECLLAQASETAEQAELHFLLGNAHRKMGHWREAMNHYLKAEELDPAGPAAEACKSVEAILSYYHKDYYNP